jgi:hypothetical protein
MTTLRSPNRFLHWGFPVRRVIGITAGLALLAGCGTDATAQSFVQDQAKNANAVVVSVQGIQEGTSLYASDPTGSAVSFQQLLSQSKETLSNVSSALSLADKPNGLDDAATEMWAATDDLSHAIDSYRAYVDNQKSSDLADFGSKWKQGRTEWNDSVTKIWNAASQTPPTVNAD